MTRRISIILVIVTILVGGGWLIHKRLARPPATVERTFGREARWWAERCREHIRELAPEGQRVRITQDGWFGAELTPVLSIGDVLATQPDEHATSWCRLAAIDHDGIILEYESTFNHQSFGKNLITIDSGQVRLPWPAGTHGAQSERRVTLLPGSKAADDVSKVAGAAKAFFQTTAEYSQYWPEPASLEEHDTYWEVGFKKKQDVVVENGSISEGRYVPGWESIRVEKSDFACWGLGAR
jgi:hypothetical protein